MRILFFICLLISTNALYASSWSRSGVTYASLQECSAPGSSNHVIVPYSKSQNASGIIIGFLIYNGTDTGQTNPGVFSCSFSKTGAPCPAGGTEDLSNGEGDDPTEIPENLCRDECSYSRTPGDIGTSNGDSWTAGYTQDGQACATDDVPDKHACGGDNTTQECADECAITPSPICPESSGSSGGSSSGGSSSGGSSSGGSSSGGSSSGGSSSGSSSSGSSSSGSSSSGSSSSGSSSSGGSSSGGSSSGGSSSGGSSSGGSSGGGECDGVNMQLCIDSGIVDIAEYCLSHPNAALCETVQSGGYTAPSAPVAFDDNAQLVADAKQAFLLKLDEIKSRAETIFNIGSLPIGSAPFIDFGSYGVVRLPIELLSMLGAIIILIATWQAFEIVFG